MTGLEARYRHLLVAYPADHRHEYGDEMIGVLMAGARPGQRFPSLVDTVDLLRSGLAMRLRAEPATAAGPGRDAAAVAALLTALALMVAGWRSAVWTSSWLASPDEMLRGASGTGLNYTPHAADLRLTAWLLVVVALVLGRRRAAVALGVPAGSVEVVLLATNTGTGWRWVSMGWLLVTVPALLALLVAASGGRGPTAVLGRRGVTLTIAGVVLGGMSGGFSYLAPGSGVAGIVTIPMLTVGAILLCLGLTHVGMDVWPSLVPLLTGLAAILVAQPVMEQAVGMYTRFAVDARVVTVEAIILTGLPLTAALLMRLLVAVARVRRGDAGERRLPE